MDEEYLKRLGLSIARGVPQMATGFVDLAALPFTMTGLLDEKDVVGGTAYLTEKGLLPPPQEGVLNETAELVSGAMSPGGALKAGLLGLGTIAGVKGGKGINQSMLVENKIPENFQNWFGESKAVTAVNPETGLPVMSSREPSKLIPRVMYHTTRNDFDQFEVGRPTTNMGTFGNIKTNRAAIFVTPDSGASQAYGTQGGEFVRGANVMPLYVKAEKPLDLTEGVSDEVAEKLIKAGLSRGFVENQVGQWSMFDGEAGKKAVQAIKKAGYDSVIFNDVNPDTGDAFEAYALFEPEQLKSVFNRGTFDPSDPRIAYGVGATGVGLGAGGLLTTEEEQY